MLISVFPVHILAHEQCSTECAEANERLAELLEKLETLIARVEELHGRAEVEREGLKLGHERIREDNQGLMLGHEKLGEGQNTIIQVLTEEKKPNLVPITDPSGLRKFITPSEIELIIANTGAVTAAQTTTRVDVKLLELGFETTFYEPTPSLLSGEMYNFHLLLPDFCTGHVCTIMQTADDGNVLDEDSEIDNTANCLAEFQ